ncbi:RIIa domain-containing protein, partial [Haematococcus lacustris]
MDIEPIYCAEQIVVSPDLADVLKAYTKEVIRRQPQNLIEFSAKYFQNLANVAASVQEAPAPSKEQLQMFLKRAGDTAVVTPEQIHALAAQTGMARSIVAKVLSVGKFESAVNIDKFLFLLLVMSCESFGAVLEGLFFVFGSTLASDRFQLLISYLAPDMDPDITSQWLMDLSSQLAAVATVTYESAAALPIVQTKL